MKKQNFFVTVFNPGGQVRQSALTNEEEAEPEDLLNRLIVISWLITGVGFGLGIILKLCA